MKIPILKDALFRSSGASLIVRVVEMGLAYVLIFVLARFLGVEEYGRYAFLLAVVNLLLILPQFGLAALLVRECGKAIANSELGKIFGLKRWAFRQAALVSLLIGIPVAIYAVISGETRFSDVAIGASFALLVLVPLATISSAILRGMGSIAASQITARVVRPAVQAAIVAAFFLVPASAVEWPLATAASAMIANAVGAVVALFIGTLLLRRALGSAGGTVTKKTSIEIPGWKASVIALGLANAIQVLDSQTGVLLLGILSTETQTALFKTAAQFAMLTSIGYVAVNIPVAPKIATHWEKGEFDEVRKVASRGSLWGTMIALPIFAFFVLFGRLFLGTTLGAEFEGAYSSLVLLSAAQLINASFGSSTSLLTMVNLEKANTVAFAIALGVTLVLALFLVEPYGSVGMAAAASIGILMRNLILWAMAIRFAGINTAFWASLTARKT